MNCQDITRILDDGDIGGMTQQERAEVEAHLFACPDCAADWKVHQRLATGFAPPVPAGLMERARALVVADGVGNTRRPPSRAILFGTILALAAAAAMLIVQLTKPAAEPAPAVKTVPAATPPVVPPSPAAPPEVVVESSARPLVEPQPQAAGKSFVVRILPLESSGSAAGKDLLGQFYHEFVTKLSGMPVLKLVTPESGGPVEEDSVNCEIIFKLIESPPRAPQLFMQVRVRRSPGPQGMVEGSGSMSTLDNVARVADRSVELLRLTTFPTDPQLQQELRAKLFNPQLEDSQRQKALSNLLSSIRAPLNRSGVDSAIITAGVDLATTAADPMIRKDVWGMLRTTRNPALVAPLVRALDTERNETVRQDLVTMLGSDFGTNPEARAALESVARDDPQQIMRMAAQRVLLGDGGWNAYVVDTLKNTTLSDTQRLEPLAYLTTSGLLARQQGKLQFDDETQRTLGTILVRAGRGPANATVIAAVGALGHTPAARDVLIDLLRSPSGQPPTEQTLRILALVTLASGYKDDPRAREVVEEVAASDPDPQFRDRVRLSLKTMNEVQRAMEGAMPGR